MVGDQVWLHAEVPDSGIPAKLFREWKGPYVVRQVLSDSLCVIRNIHSPSVDMTVHFNRLKPIQTSIDHDTICDGEPVEEYEVPAEGGIAQALRPVLS